MNAHAMSPASFERAAAPVFTTRKAPPKVMVLASVHDESQLIAMLRKGDARAFDALVRQNHGALIRMAMRYVSDRDVAEEVVQDTWIAVIDGIQRFEGRSSLKTWIFSILIHKAKDRGVRESKHITFSALESDGDDQDEGVDPARFQVSGELAGHWAMPPQPWNEQTPEALLSSKQAIQALSNALDALPKSLRDVLVLKDVEGFESQEICERLHITETNLYVRLHRARERVREAVETALKGNSTRDVSSGGFATLMGTAQAIARRTCPVNPKSAAITAGR